ncbi:S8 family serine peptidase [Candidatus Uhrbacteria bacterium]|nr:S8 family serine peptidase [Candidatus Uhrbacteria bacterium]
MLRAFFRFAGSVLGIISLAFVQPVLALVPNDPLLEDQWYLERVHAFEAWDRTTGSDDVVVAVLDTGLDLDHADLVSHVWTNGGEVAGDGIDNDGNGFVDDVYGWDFVEDDATPFPSLTGEFNQSAASHGTLIAGIVGAVADNGDGIAGLNWHVRIMPVRMLDDLGSGDSVMARKAVDYAVANGADVINLSFTGFDFDPAFLRSIQTAYELGVTVVAAAGNDGNGGVDLNETPIYPACFVSSEGADLVLGVAATDREDAKAGFSNYGSQCVDLSAPGVDVIGTMYQDISLPEFKGAYGGLWSGTSIAAPMVSGAVALLKGAYPSLRPDTLRTVLQLSVDPVREQDPALSGQLGAGRIQLARALEIGASFASLVSGGNTSSIRRSSLSFVASQDAGGISTVRRLDVTGHVLNEFSPYAPGFSGGVRVAMGDVDGDGVDEIVTGAGPGGGPHVRVFEADGTLHSQFFAYGQDKRQGVFVASGDVDGDRVDEIIVSPDQGGGGEVRIFAADGTQLFSFFPFDRVSQAIRVALGDLDGDGTDELVAALGVGGKPRIRLFEGNGTFLREFDAYHPSFQGGVAIAMGDLDGDGVDEIVTGAGPGGGPHVRVFEADGTLRTQFFSYAQTFRGGVRVAAGDLDGDGVDEIVTGAGPGGGPHVQVFDGSGQARARFFAFDTNARFGLELGIW